MYTIKLGTMIIGIEELTREEVRARENEGFTVEKRGN